MLLLAGGEERDGGLGDLVGEGAAGFGDLGFCEDDLDAAEFPLVFEF